MTTKPTPKPKHTLSGALLKLAKAIEKDEFFVAPNNWEDGEILYLIRKAAQTLKEKGE